MRYCLKGRYPAELSGGQKQRVGIARALNPHEPQKKLKLCSIGTLDREIKGSEAENAADGKSSALP
jgi:ABC-type dipeptide/oligopeptide/nickel transport system ATPase subunit